MATLLEAPQSILAPEETVQKTESKDEFFVVVNLVGATLHCVVNPQWPIEALFGVAAEAYLCNFPNTEVPECNLVYHCNLQQILDPKVPIFKCCAKGDELDLEVSDSGKMSTKVNFDANRSEFCVIFHKLPLGFTMKRGLQNNTEVGTVFPRSAASRFSRLVPGITIVNIAETPLATLGLRQVHELIKSAVLPLSIRFRELECKPTLSSIDKELQLEEAPLLIPALNVALLSPSQHPDRRRKGSFDRRSAARSNSASGRNRHSRTISGRGKTKGSDSSSTTAQKGSKKDPTHHEMKDLRKSHDSLNNEAQVIEQIERLKVALLRKHEEAKQIARQLETCSEQLLALRGGVILEEFSSRQLNQEPSRLRSRRVVATLSSTNETKVRLTSEVLKAMDQNVGLSRRRAYASSNTSSVSAYSARSMPVARSTTVHTRSARATTLADNVSVSSNASNSSTTSAHQLSPRNTALRNRTKRYNYMPQKYSATTSNALDNTSTSLSSRGAVMSRARISRDSFITRSESPGVGYYDVQVKDRVKGGEIGDSDRSLVWT